MRSERKKNWNFGEAEVFPDKLFIMLLKVDLSFVFVCELQWVWPSRKLFISRLVPVVLFTLLNKTTSLAFEQIEIANWGFWN